jgi:hypothetical protein
MKGSNAFEKLLSNAVFMFKLALNGSLSLNGSLNAFDELNAELNGSLMSVVFDREE